MNFNTGSGSHAWIARTAFVLAGVTLYLGISMWAYLPWWDLALRSDASPASWLSGALLFACGALAFQIHAQHILPRWLSGWLSLSMIAMALDEQFMYHEVWKYKCHRWTSWCGRAGAGHIDWLGDAPMALVGILGVATLIILWRTVGSRVARGLMVSAVGVGVVMALGTHFGHALNLLPPDVSALEEAFEILAEALFLCALVELSLRRPDAFVHQVQSASSS